MENVRIGFDLGGTNMGAAIVSGEGEILFKSEGPTLGHESVENITGRMKGLIKNCVNEAKNKNWEFKSIGMGCPGLLDSNTGVVKFSPNLPHWSNVEIGRIISEEFNVPVRIDNDVRVATLGEFNFGAGKGHKNLICITVGTGIGGGIVLDGQLMRGPTQSMGEIGHMTLKKDGPLCGCGNHGCFESLASATAIIRNARYSIESGKSEIMRKFTDQGEHISAFLVTKAALQGDPEAVRIIRETAMWIGIGLANVINLLNPELVIIGGGVAQAGDILFNPVREEIAKRALKIPGNFARVVPASLGDYAGMIGASTLS